MTSKSQFSVVLALCAVMGIGVPSAHAVPSTSCNLQTAHCPPGLSSLPTPGITVEITATGATITDVVSKAVFEIDSDNLVVDGTTIIAPNADVTADLGDGTATITYPTDLVFVDFFATMIIISHTDAEYTTTVKGHSVDLVATDYDLKLTDVGGGPIQGADRYLGVIAASNIAICWSSGETSVLTDVNFANQCLSDAGVDLTYGIDVTGTIVTWTDTATGLVVVQQLRF